MMLNKIWERYFFIEVFKVTVFFLVGFYFLYFLIDYSTRSAAWTAASIPFHQILLYYVYVYLRHIDILLPFALLLAAIRTMCTLNLHHELIALLASGIPMKRLLRPFVILGLLCTGLMYVQFQALVPYGVHASKYIEDHYLKDSARRSKQQPVLSCVLQDGSVLLYQSYDAAREQLFDVFWIRSLDDIVRIKQLVLKRPTPEGHFVDHLVRDSKGSLQKVESLPTQQFTQLTCDETLLLNALHTSEELSLSQLWQSIPASGRPLADREAQTLTWLYKRLTMPWLCLLAVIAPAPFCLTFTRQLPTLMIYLVALLALVFLFLVLNAAAVVAQAQVLPPLIAITTPMALCGGYFGWKYIRFQS